MSSGDWLGKWSKSIRLAKPFAFVPTDKTVKSKEETFGTIDKIFLNDKEVSVDDWEIFANNLKSIYKPRLISRC